MQKVKIECFIHSTIWLSLDLNKIGWGYSYLRKTRINNLIQFQPTWLFSTPLCDGDVLSGDPLKRVRIRVVLEANVDNLSSLSHDGGHLGLFKAKNTKVGENSLMAIRCATGSHK